MQEENALSWLAAAEPLWAGHWAALTARLSQPSAARLTEEQEALALGLTARLVLHAAKLLPLASEPEDIWARWEVAGLPASAALAPALFARVEEFRWRWHQPQVPALAATPLFQPQSAGLDTAIAAPLADMPLSGVESAYLQLRVADGLRTNAIGQPLLLPHELPPAALRALMLDLAAQDLTLIGDGQGRAADLARAIDNALATSAPDAIDVAARRYCDALGAANLTGEAAFAAISRRDWLAVVALVSGAQGAGFSRTAAALLAASDAQIVAALGEIGIASVDAGPLLDALADVTGRPDTTALSTPGEQNHDTLAAVAARATQLRGDAS